MKRIDIQALFRSIEDRIHDRAEFDETNWEDVLHLLKACEGVLSDHHPREIHDHLSRIENSHGPWLNWMDVGLAAALESSPDPNGLHGLLWGTYLMAKAWLFEMRLSRRGNDQS